MASSLHLAGLAPIFFDEEASQIVQTTWLNLDRPTAQTTGPARGSWLLLDDKRNSFQSSIQITNRNVMSTYALVVRKPLPRQDFKGNVWKTLENEWIITTDLVPAQTWTLHTAIDVHKKTFLLRAGQTVNIHFDARNVEHGAYGMRINAVCLGTQLVEQIVCFVRVGNLGTGKKIVRINENGHDELAKRDLATVSQLVTSNLNQIINALDEDDQAPSSLLGLLPQISSQFPSKSSNAARQSRALRRSSSTSATSGPSTPAATPNQSRSQSPKLTNLRRRSALVPIRRVLRPRKN